MSGFYFIKSRLSGLVLDIEKGSTNPGAKVIPWEKHGKDNQLWYDDPVTGTIRSKLTNFCLDVEGDQLVVKPFEAGDPGQGWERHGQTIRNRKKTNTVLDIFRKNKKPGAQIGSYEHNGGENQLWDFEFVGGVAPFSQSQTPRRNFYIVSERNQKVVDIQAGNSDPDVKVLMWTKESPQKKSQLWYVDPQGFIRSVLNNMVFQNKEEGEKLKTRPFSSDPRGHWAIDAGTKKIVNGLGECLDIKGESDEDGAKLISYKFKDSPNQHWHVDYV